MFMFDLQRFAEPIPEELAGISEDVARNIMSKAAQPADTEKSADNPVDTTNPNDVKVSYSRFKETLDQRNDFERELAAYREKYGDINAQTPPPVQQSQQHQQPQNRQPPPAPPIQNLTADMINDFENAINFGAKQLSGFSDEQIDELNYLDDDDPRIKQWNFAKRIAESAVYNNYIANQVAQQQEFQQRALMQNQSVAAFNDYVARQQAAEIFAAVQQFAANEFFNSLSDLDKVAINDARYRIENNMALPTDLMAVRDFFSRAKAAYDSRNAAVPQQPRNSSAPQFPRTDKLNGVPGSGGGVTSSTRRQQFSKFRLKIGLMTRQKVQLTSTLQAYH